MLLLCARVQHAYCLSRLRRFITRLSAARLSSDNDPKNKIGPKKPLPDNVSVVEPKEEKIYETPETEYKIPPPSKPLDDLVEPKVL